MPAATIETSLDELRSVGAGRELRGLELPEVQSVGPWTTGRPTRKAILGDRFYVYGQATELRPPIDWLENPHGSRTWRYELHTLTWLKEALARHAGGGDVETLAVAREVVLDWARQHMRAGSEEVSEFAWYDMAVGLRAPYIGYVLRACRNEEMLGEEDAELLLEAAERHGAELADVRNYSAAHNHGLFQNEGLYLLARQLPVLPAASAWRELARVRMMATLEETVSFEDGAHLEHSAAYQLAIVELIARLAANVRDLPELGDLLDRMRRTAAWQVTPAKRVAQLGDTDDLPAPRWARDTAAGLRGMRVLFEAGQAFVREGDGYLAVSAAHHSAAHKHSDDTGFVLVENGQVLLGDAGRWGYYEDEPDRIYARSAAAHNVLTVDGEDFAWRETEPYGSGIEAAGEGDGWYAIVVRNPLLARQGVTHRRVLLYRPAEALIVLDEVLAAEPHEYARRFHFGPELTAKRSRRSGQVTLAADGISAVLADASEAKVELARGRDEPRLGWIYPGDRERVETWTATLRSRAASATLATALTLRDDPLEVIVRRVEPSQVELQIGTVASLRLSLDGRSATIESR